MDLTRPWWLLVCLASSAAADSPWLARLAFETEAVAGPGLSVEGVSAQLEWPGGPLVLTVDALRTAKGSPLSEVRLECPVFALGAGGSLSCESGRLSFDHPLASPRDMPVRLRWDPDKGGDVRLANAPLAGKDVRLSFMREEGAWKVKLDTSGTDLAAVAAVLSPTRGLALAGQAYVHGDFEVVGGNLQRVELDIEHADTAFQNPGAGLIAEALAGHISVALMNTDGRWQGNVKGRWKQGEVLSPFGYLQTTSANPFTISARITADAGSPDVTLDDFRLTQAPWMDMEGHARLDLESSPLFRRLDVRLSEIDVGAVYERYLEPVLGHPLLTALELSGRAHGRISLEHGVLRGLQVGLEDLLLKAETDTAGYSVAGVNGQMAFGPGSAQSGVLQWQSARLFDFPIGPTRIPLSFGEHSVSTAGLVKVPVFDGVLEIERFALDWSRAPPDITLDALLLPVAMEEVSTALGWIPMKGKLSGVLPRVAVSQGALAVGGNLLVQVFDGNIVIRNLKISDLFGYWPVLTADAECRRLDLEMLTGTYEFGRITGRVDGVVEGLRLENWRPTAFDARFETTPGDSSRHRISQRAVDNLTSLAGGASGVLSRTVLRFFDEFNYDRLGIGCRLRNGVCRMDGVEAAENGYYLVKGGGIPRIDVIGFNRSIDWDLLVERLAAVTTSGPPIIE